MLRGSRLRTGLDPFREQIGRGFPIDFRFAPRWRVSSVKGQIKQLLNFLG